MNSINDFDIKNGVLRLYIGSDTDVTVPNGVTKIGKKAFESCYELKSVVIPAGVTEIGESAFENCFELKKVSLPDGLKTICKRAFAYCGIESLHFPDSVTEIGERAFDACINFSSITVPEGTVNIDELAFGEWMIIKSFYFKNRLFEDIPDGYRFRNSLQGFVSNYKKDKAADEIINSYIRYFRAELCGEIGLRYVADNTELVQFAAEQQALSAEEAEILLSMLPEKESGEARAVLTEYISSRKKEDNLQPGGTSLKDIVKEWSFRNNADGTVTLTKYFGSKTDIICPSYICGRPVTEISYKLFRNTRVSSVILPDGLTRLHDGIFFNCTNLTSVTVPEGVTGIGKKAFYLCRSLSSLKLPDSVTEIGEDAFHCCRSLTAVTVPDGVTSIGNEAFNDCDSLELITIPESVTSFGVMALGSSDIPILLYFKNRPFDNIPDEYKTVYALTGFVQNYEVDKPSEEIIRSYAGYFESVLWSTETEFILRHKKLIGFAVNYSVLTAEDGDYLLSVMPEYQYTEERAMLIEYISTHDNGWYEMSLNYVPLSEILAEWEFRRNTDGTVTLTKYIGSSKTVTCPAEIEGRKVTGIGNLAFLKKAVTSVTVCEGIESIGRSAFSGCRELSSIRLPGGLKSIGEAAFAGCLNLESIDIPDSVKSINAKDFGGCFMLRTVYIGKNTAIRDNSFEDCPNAEFIIRV